MPAAMTACPKGDQYDAVSTVVRPVTHTADTAVKSTSTKGADSSEAEAIGSMSSAVMTPMISANVLRASRAGEYRACRDSHARTRCPYEVGTWG